MAKATSSEHTEGCLPPSLDLPSTLRQRILCRVQPPPPPPDEGIKSPPSSSLPSSFILYLPTVVLRQKHNPGFALACRLANHHNVPVVVLAVVLDDNHITQTPVAPVTQTARRLAFVLEALQSCTKEWQRHGALTLIRVHGPGRRQAHHLTLTRQAVAVVTDEPFVEPYRTYMRRIVKSCRPSGSGSEGGGRKRVPCYTVDGSTTVPPCMKLRPFSTSSKSNSNSNAATSHFDWEDGDLHFSGAPAKAWKWEEQTKGIRKTHVYAACRDRALDAPELRCKVPADLLTNPDHYENSSPSRSLLDRLPSSWKKPITDGVLSTDSNNTAPGQRPWTVDELAAISDCKEWAMTCWDGADVTVPPCRQTHGSQAAGVHRWTSFVQSGRIKDYAKQRNRVAEPHSVSRISCYLNLGILSVFDVIHDVWHVQASRPGYATGTRKFLDEIIKFREGSYVHCFSTPYYHLESVLPVWSRRHLDTTYKTSNEGRRQNGFSFEQLSSASTGDEVWDAMQGYLIETGELHNNARMTWGKTIVHWQARDFPARDVLHQLVCLNDRFALDGLSPPSYFGLLWCAGFQDKPSTSTGGRKLISTKWASQYRQGATGFEVAMTKLDQGDGKGCFPANEQTLTTINGPPAAKKMRHSGDSNSSKSKSILSYFSPVSSQEVEGAKKTVG